MPMTEERRALRAAKLALDLLAIIYYNKWFFRECTLEERTDIMTKVRNFKVRDGELDA